jgi:energy-coupling factor transport system permease protein
LSSQRDKAQPLLATAENGLYQPGETLLHRLDPRVKVLSCLLLVILAFAATGWVQILTLVVSTSVAFWLIPSLANSLWRICWTLRWILLFTLLMHLLFSPGRTLWGLRWLSLDGLLIGSFVCAQMLLAVLLSALLAITTSTKTLASTFGWFVQPLQWMGCKTEEWQKILLLTMDFIPIVQEETRVAASPEGEASDEATLSASKSRWATWSDKLQNLLLRLVGRGDEIAQRIAANDETLQSPVSLSPLLPMALLDQLFSLLITLLIVSYWLAG